MLSTVFSVIFAILNTYLASLTIYNPRLKLPMTVFTITVVMFSVMQTNFIWEDMTYHTTVSIIIAIVYTIVIVVSFGFISQAIMDEQVNEAKLSYQMRDQFRRMFNGLQEGIIVIDDGGKMNFINELANKVLSELAGLRNFFKNKNYEGSLAHKDQLDRKLFFLFENVQDD